MPGRVKCGGPEDEIVVAHGRLPSPLVAWFEPENKLQEYGRRLLDSSLDFYSSCAVCTDYFTLLVIFKPFVKLFTFKLHQIPNLNIALMSSS